MIQNLLTGIRAEHIKFRHSGFRYLILFFALIAPAIYVLRLIFDDSVFSPDGYPYNIYTDGINPIIQIFSGFFLPLFIVISAVRINQIDHKNNAWRLMETQPLEKISIFLSKFFWLLYSILLVIVFFVIFSILEIFIYSLIRDVPEIASTNLEVGKSISLIIRLFFSTFSFAAVMFILGMLISNSILSIGLGFFIIIIHAIANGFGIPLKIAPLSIIKKVDQVDNTSELGHFFTYDIYIGILIAFVILALGYHYFKFRNFYYAFISSKFRGFTALVGLIISGILIYFLAQPKTMDASNETVIVGDLDSDKSFKTIQLLDGMNNPIANAPIVDNEYRLPIEGTLPLDYYKLTFDNEFVVPVAMSENDSTYVRAHYKNLSPKFEITGTRLAENNINKNVNFNKLDFYVNNKEYLENPERFLKLFEKSYNESAKRIDKYATSDNYKVRPDFVEKQKVLLDINFVNYWNTYTFTRKGAMNLDTPKNDFVENLINNIPLNDSSLLNEMPYKLYLKEQLTKNDHRELDENTKYLDALKNLPASDFKNRALGLQLEESLTSEADSITRNQLMANYLPAIQNKNYQNRLIQVNNSLKNRSANSKLHDFQAIGFNNDVFTLEDFKGKYMIIDLWATWCQPCLKEAPYLEKYAYQYQHESDVVFVSLSVDEKENDWRAMMSKKAPSPVKQLYLKDGEKFTRAINLQTIPRFLFIDPDGNIINDNMPYPSDFRFANELSERLQH